MELRVLRYFLAVAREESISDAAEFLHITQPTLSRQLMDLEEELGKQLLIRGKRNRKIMLTEDGMRLRKRAEEIVALADKTEAEFLAADDAVSGDVYIGCGESDAMRIIAKTAVKLRQDYPDIHFHLYSGNAEDVSERMEKGLLDFGIFITSANIDKYDYLKLPAYDTWGLIMRKSDKLAAKDFITPQDLQGLPLIMSRQALVQEDISRWSKKQIQDLNVVATYNLVYNAAIMTREGFGYTLTLDKLANTGSDSDLCFRPLKPELRIRINLNLVWKKYQIFSKASQKFLEYLKNEINA